MGVRTRAYTHVMFKPRPSTFLASLVPTPPPHEEKRVWLLGRFSWHFERFKSCDYHVFHGIIHAQANFSQRARSAASDLKVSPYKRGRTGTGKRQFRCLPDKDALTKWLPRTETAWYILFSHYLRTRRNKICL